MSTPQKSDAARLRHGLPGLRERLILWLALPLLVILIGSLFIDYFAARQIADRMMDQILADDLFDLEAHLQASRGVAPLALGDEARAMLRSAAPDLLFYVVRDAAGRALIGAPDLHVDGRVGTSGVPELSNAEYRGQPVRVASLRIAVLGQSLDVAVAQTTLRRSEAQRTLLAAMLWPNIAVVALTLLAVGFGVNRGLRPLTSVEHEIAKRSANDLRPFELADVPAEIRPLLHRLNELFAMVREASHVQQRFIADAAHQLKTPLAVLRNQVDLALGADESAPDPAWLGRVDGATGRMSHLLDRLLAHARAEAAGPPAVPVALEQLLEESATDSLDTALARDIDLGFEVVPSTVEGSRWMLREALANLVDNAIRYTQRGGIVTVRCGCDDGHAFLEVQDNGPGIAPELHSRVMERFYRPPGSSGEGCGLGLSIVQEIARRHGAVLALAEAEGGGLKVRIEFATA